MAIQTNINDKYNDLIQEYLAEDSVKNYTEVGGMASIGDGEQFQTYVLDLNDIINENFISSKAQQTGAIAFNAKNPKLKEFNVYDVGGNTKAQIVGHSQKETSLIQKLKKTVDWANNNVDIIKQFNYIGQYLIIPGLHTSLLWLKPDDNKSSFLQDLFIPMKNWPDIPIKTETAYNEKQLLDALKPVAEKVLEKIKAIPSSADV